MNCEHRLYGYCNDCWLADRAKLRAEVERILRVTTGIYLPPLSPQIILGLLDQLEAEEARPRQGRL